jgi:succinyl-diaminopimelate desuccinylase
MINKQRLIRLIRKLVQIDSQNPGSTEKEIAGFVGDYLRRLGLKIKIYEFKKDRSNLIAYLSNPRSKKSLLITPHLDTVPAGRNWNFGPFAGKIHNGRLYGLGATDCKCNVAAGMEAINSLVEDNVVLDYNLVFAATADEETGSDHGLIPLINKGILKPDVAVVLDADDFEVVVSQKGLIHLKVKISSKKAHGAYPWLGVNAIGIAVDILEDLKRYKFIYKKNKYLRPPTVNVGTIRGGDKVNIVADWCEFELDFRYLPGMRAENILRDLKTIISRHTKKFKIEISGIQKDYSIAKDHPLVSNFSAALKGLGMRPRISGSEGATTITFFQDKNIPAIATGFGVSGCAHTVNEYVKINDLYKGSRVLEGFLKKYKF